MGMVYYFILYTLWGITLTLELFCNISISVMFFFCRFVFLFHVIMFLYIQLTELYYLNILLGQHVLSLLLRGSKAGEKCLLIHHLCCINISYSAINISYSAINISYTALNISYSALNISYIAINISYSALNISYSALNICYSALNIYDMICICAFSARYLD